MMPRCLLETRRSNINLFVAAFCVIGAAALRMGAVELVNYTPTRKFVEIVEYRPHGPANMSAGYVIFRDVLAPWEKRFVPSSCQELFVDVQWGEVKEISGKTEYVVRESDPQRVALWTKIGEEFIPRIFGVLREPIVLPPGSTVRENERGTHFTLSDGKSFVIDRKDRPTMRSVLAYTIPYRIIDDKVIEKVEKFKRIFSKRRAERIHLTHGIGGAAADAPSGSQTSESVEAAPPAPREVGRTDRIVIAGSDECVDILVLNIQ